MSPDILAGAVGVILSLVFSYVPGLNVKFAALESGVKRLIMLGLIVITAAVCYGLACWGVLAELTGLSLSCDRAGLYGLLRIVVLTIIANQAVYQISPRLEAVEDAKYSRYADPGE